MSEAPARLCFAFLCTYANICSGPAKIFIEHDFEIWTFSSRLSLASPQVTQAIRRDSNSWRQGLSLMPCRRKKANRSSPPVHRRGSKPDYRGGYLEPRTSNLEPLTTIPYPPCYQSNQVNKGQGLWHWRALTEGAKASKGANDLWGNVTLLKICRKLSSQAQQLALVMITTMPSEREQGLNSIRTRKYGFPGSNLDNWTGSIGTFWFKELRKRSLHWNSLQMIPVPFDKYIYIHITSCVVYVVSTSV